MPSLTLVLPAFNEELNLEEAIGQALPHLMAITPLWEIVIVNDGSRDRTGALADALAAAHPGRIRPVHLAHNQGLGGALRAGFGAARGEVIVYADSDLPFDMVALEHAYALLHRSGADLVCGFRTNRELEGRRRRVYSVVYNRLVRFCFGLRVRDVNFSLKMFRREVGECIGLASQGSFIDAELLARTSAAGFRIAELGVAYTPRVRGVSTLARPGVIVGILRELHRYTQGRLVPAGPLVQPRVSGDSLPAAADVHVVPAHRAL